MFRDGDVRLDLTLDIFRLIGRLGIFRLNLSGVLHLGPNGVCWVRFVVFCKCFFCIWLFLRFDVFFGFDEFGRAVQLNSAGARAGSSGKGFSFCGLCLCLIGQRPYFRGSVRCAFRVHRNQFRVKRRFGGRRRWRLRSELVTDGQA